MPLLYADIALDQYADAALTPWLWQTGPVNGVYTPVDLTGCSARMMIRVSDTDTTPIVSLTTTPNAQGSIVLGGTAGTIAVTINKAVFTQATPLTSGKYRWSLFIDFPNGTSTPVLEGNVYVGSNPTH